MDNLLKFCTNIRDSIREYSEDAQSEVEKGHNFLHWVLTRVFEATEDDATDAIVDGANDLGIDAYLPVDFSEDKIISFNPSMALRIHWSNCQIQRRC